MNTSVLPASCWQGPRSSTRWRTAKVRTSKFWRLARELFGHGIISLLSCQRLSAILYLLLAILSPLVHAATFTSAVTISETDSTYDGQNIILNGATVSINGAHGFNSLMLTNNAVFTHSLCTATATHKLDLTESRFARGVGCPQLEITDRSL